ASSLRNVLAQAWAYERRDSHWQTFPNFQGQVILRTIGSRPSWHLSPGSQSLPIDLRWLSSPLAFEIKSPRIERRASKVKPLAATHAGEFDRFPVKKIVRTFWKVLAERRGPRDYDRIFEEQSHQAADGTVSIADDS